MISDVLLIVVASVMIFTLGFKFGCKGYEEGWDKLNERE